MKNKKALDNIRNTQAGHIQIDYRICCAMLNFSMKPCIPDGIDSVKIAQSLRKRCLKSKNKLESLLVMRFTSSIPSVLIETINDFPKLTRMEIKKHVTFGSFKLKQCQSYLGQVMEHGQAYFLNYQVVQKYVSSSKIIKELQFSKIIAFLIPSRHKRGKKWRPMKQANKNASQFTSFETVDPKDFNTCYKVFIQYISINDIKTAQNHNIIKRSSKPYHLLKSENLFI